MEVDRFLIVGLGSAGSRHLRTVRSLLPKADIRVLRHRQMGQVRARADGCFYRISDAIQFKPQVAVVANPAPFHLKTSICLVKNGCHLLIEKPLADRSRGIEKLLKKAAQNKRILQVGYNLRFLPSLIKFRHLIHVGKIGRPLAIHAEVGQFLPSWRPASNYRKGVSARKELGGGVLLELSHEIDYLRWIFGPIRWVSAWTGKIGELEVNVEDLAKLQLGFLGKQGKLGPVASLNLDFIRQDPVRFCEATGTKGSLRWNGIRGTIAHFSPGCGWKLIHGPRENCGQSYTAQLKSFLRSVRYGRKPQVSGEDGHAVLKILEAAKKSNANRGSRINVNLVRN